MQYSRQRFVMDFVTNQRKLGATSRNTALWYIFIIQTVLGPEQRGSFAYSTIFLCSPLLQSSLGSVKCRTRRVTRDVTVMFQKHKTRGGYWDAGLHQTCAGLRGLSMKRSLTQPPTHTHTLFAFVCMCVCARALACASLLSAFATLCLR